MRLIPTPIFATLALPILLFVTGDLTTNPAFPNRGKIKWKSCTRSQAIDRWSSLTQHIFDNPKKNIRFIKETENYWIISTTNDGGLLRPFKDKLDGDFKLIQDLFPVQKSIFLNRQKPLTMIFSSKEEYLDYVNRPDLETFMKTSLATAGDGFWATYASSHEGTYRLHETAHLYLGSYYKLETPGFWFSEGLAHLVEMEYTNNKRLRIHNWTQEVINGKNKSVANGKPAKKVPFRILFDNAEGIGDLVKDASSLDVRWQSASFFWLLCHYESNQTPSLSFYRFIELLGQQKSADADTVESILDTCFGWDLPRLEREWVDFFSPKSSIPLKPAKRAPSDVKRQ